jgi:hypothetical protein
MKSMTITEFEKQIRKSEAAKANLPSTTKPEPVTPDAWWENYRSGSFC